MLHGLVPSRRLARCFPTLPAGAAAKVPFCLLVVRHADTLQKRVGYLRFRRRRLWEYSVICTKQLKTYFHPRGQTCGFEIVMSDWNGTGFVQEGFLYSIEMGTLPVLPE